MAGARNDSPGRISVATQPAIPLPPVAESPVPRKRGISPAEASVLICIAAVKQNSPACVSPQSQEELTAEVAESAEERQTGFSGLSCASCYPVQILVPFLARLPPVSEGIPACAVDKWQGLCHNRARNAGTRFVATPAEGGDSFPYASALAVATARPIRCALALPSSDGLPLTPPTLGIDLRVRIIRVGL